MHNDNLYDIAGGLLLAAMTGFVLYAWACVLLMAMPV